MTDKPLSSSGLRADTLLSLAESETEAFGKRLGSRLSGGELILLCGQLGSGKTVFVRGLASGLGIDPSEIHSPTFVLVSEHRGRLTLHHVDLYRLDRPEEALDLGLEEFLDLGGVVAVEWGDRLPERLKAGGIEIRFEDLGEDSRRLSLRVVPRPRD